MRINSRISTKLKANKTTVYLIILAILIVSFCAMGIYGAFDKTTEYGFMDFNNHSTTEYTYGVSSQSHTFRLPFQEPYHKYYLLIPTDQQSPYGYRLLIPSGEYYINGTILLDGNNGNLVGSGMSNVTIHVKQGANPAIIILPSGTDYDNTLIQDVVIDSLAK